MQGGGGFSVLDALASPAYALDAAIDSMAMIAMTPDLIADAMVAPIMAMDGVLDGMAYGIGRVFG